MERFGIRYEKILWKVDKWDFSNYVMIIWFYGNLLSIGLSCKGKIWGYNMKRFCEKWSNRILPNYSVNGWIEMCQGG